MKKHRTNEKIMKHIEKNKEQSWHTLKQIMKTMTNIEKHNEQYWKKQWKPWTTLKNQWKIMKNIEKQWKLMKIKQWKTLKEIMRLHSQNTVS